MIQLVPDRLLILLQIHGQPLATLHVYQHVMENADFRVGMVVQVLVMLDA